MDAPAWPVSSPSAEGVDAGGVLALLDALEASPGLDPHGLVLLRHGSLVAQGWWAPYGPDRVQLLYSLSKTFTCAAVGLAVGEGLLGLDDTVLSHRPDLDAEVRDPRSRALTVRHLLAMSSGHTSDTGPRALADPVDPVRAFLRMPPEQEPGSVFAYNQSCTYTLAQLVQGVTGQTLTAWLRPRLFDPLGIGPASWQQHPAGSDLGFSGLHATTDAVARLGQLLLQDGVWQGRRLLPQGWVVAASTRQVATDAEPYPDWQQGYGWQLWQGRHGYRGDGAFGQFCVVLPEQDAVVAITSATSDMQSVLDALWEHLLPAMRDSAPATHEDALRERLTRLELSPVAGGAGPDADFAPAAGTCADQPSLTGVRVERDADGWSLTLREGGAELRAELGLGGWAESEPVGPDGQPVPVAVSGGWTGDVFRADVLFLETPHRLVLTGHRQDGRFEARWATAPLSPGPLHELHAPVPVPGAVPAR